MNTGGVGRGDSVAVIGCGGVGDAAIAGAASPVPRRSSRSTSTRGSWSGPRISAPPTPSTRREVDDVVEAVQELTDGFGADVVIDAVGRPETCKQAFYARDLAGTVVLVGVPTPDMKLEMPLIDFFGRGGALKSSWYGDCLPTRDFPMLVDLYQQGRFDLDAFVTETIALDDVEDAFEKMHRGECCARWWCSDGACGSTRRHVRHVLAGRRDLRRRQQRLGRRRRQRVRRHRRRARRRRDPQGGRRPHASWRCRARTRTTTTSRVAPDLADATGAPIAAAPGRPTCCGT